MTPHTVSVEALNSGLQKELSKLDMQGGSFTTFVDKAGNPRIDSLVNANGDEVPITRDLAGRLIGAATLSLNDVPGEGRFVLPGFANPARPTKPERKDYPNEVEYFKAAAKFHATE